MFERYTEKARRVIFFARYEASQYGSTDIDTEHLLLGLLREEKSLYRWLPKAQPETLRQQIDSNSPKREPTPTNIDLPLSSAAKRVLKYAASEADRLAQKDIGTEHLLLGLLDAESCYAAKLLRESGAEASKLRVQFAARSTQQWAPFQHYDIQVRGLRAAAPHESVEIHGSFWSLDYVFDAFKRCREYNWHWHEAAWVPRDIAIDRKTGRFSFDLSLAEDSANFTLVKGGWKKDHCAICRWELFESNDDLQHGTGYTNGREWLCTECYEKFLLHPNFFSSNYPEIT
jgi:hypothetical protein